MNFYTVSLFLIAVFQLLSPSRQDIISDTLDVIKAGVSTINIKEDDQVILFLGNTKSGTSTVVQILTNDNKNLIKFQNEDGIICIQDNNNYIGQSMYSQTITPNIFNYNNTLFIDLPGVDTELSADTNVFTNIITSSLTRYTLSSSRFVKFVFVLDSKTFSIGTPFDVFLQFLTDLKKLIINTSLYGDLKNMILVINKVNHDLTNDEYKVHYVNYMSQSLNYSQQSPFYNNDEKEFIRNMTNTMKDKIVILNQVVKNDGFINIRAAYDQNKLVDKSWKKSENNKSEYNVTLDTDELIQSERLALLESIQTLEFHNKNQLNVGFPISQKTSNYLLLDFVNYINENMSLTTGMFEKYAEESYQRKIDQIKDIEYFINETKSDVNNLDTLNQQTRHSENIKDFMLQTKLVTEKIGIKVPETAYNTMKELQMYVDNIEMITNTKCNLDKQSWIINVDLMTSVAKKVLLWYEFISDLYNKLSGYKVQTNIDLYNVKDLSNWGIAGSEQGLIISESNFKVFIKTAVTDFYGEDSKYVKLFTVSPDLIKINDLNIIIERSFRSNMTISLENDTLYVSSQNVRSSQINGVIANYPNVSIFNFVALKSFVVDADVDINTTQHVSIFAYSWVSDNVQHFLLSRGIDAANFSKAAGGVNGTVGLPGGNSGNFYNLGFENDKLKLNINTIGGAGGRGEDGGDGSSGTEFTKNPVQESSCSIDLDGSIFFYESSTCGENGAHGGIGGLAGKGGNIDMVWLQNKSPHVVCSSLDGAGGESGIGGQGGQSGRTGYYVEKYVISDTYYENKEHPWYVRPPRRQNGSTGVLTEQLQTPGEITDQHIFVKSVNRYKDFLANVTTDKFDNANARRILEVIDLRENVNIYTLLDYFEEFKHLNKRFSEVLDQEESTYFYKIFENKILSKLEYLVGGQEGNRKAVAHLLTAVRSKLGSFLRQDGGLIIDIEGYLDVVLTTVADLNTFINEKNDEKIKEQQIALRDEFKADIERKITEALSYIDNTLRPEMENKFNEISNSVDTLINETNQLLEQGEQVMEELEETKRRLQSAFILEQIFGIFWFSAKTALGFGNTAGQVLGSFMGQISLPTGSVLGDGSELPNLNVPEGVFALPKLIYSNWLLRRNLTADFLSILYDDMNTKLDENDELLQIITEVRQSIYENKVMSSIPDMLKPISDEINSRLSSGIITDETGLAEVTIAGMPDLITTLNERDTNERVSRNDLKIVNDAILETKMEMYSLLAYLSEIEYILIPVLTNMEENVNEVMDSLNRNQTGAFLELTKWGVQSALKDLSSAVSKFTEGFGVEDEFARELEDVQDIFVTIINIYDRIQGWQEQENLVSFIANIMSAGSENIEITDPALKSAVDEMELNMKLNILITQYNKAISAFKQWVIPFADPYINEINFNITGNNDEVFKEIERRMTNLKNFLKDYYSRVDEFDKYISESNFDSASKTSLPFMRWNNSIYQDSISDLLGGKEVILSSIPGMNMFHAKNTIKFNKLNLVMKLISPNETLENELTDLLEYFDIQMTHLGNNYYAYNGEVYSISNDNLLFMYSFQIDPNTGEPFRYNNVYKKILNGDLMLSPFTKWKFQLLSNENKKKKKAFPTFADFDRFKSLINLELIGHGKYIFPVDGALPQLKMDNYYTKV